MTKRDSISDRVQEHLSNSEKIKIRGMAELSERAVAVIDNLDETNVYFDSLSYEIMTESIWIDLDGKNRLFPAELKGTGLGVLKGISCFPPVRGYNDTLEFAKGQLTPLIQEANWYKNPLELKRIPIFLKNINL